MLNWLPIRLLIILMIVGLITGAVCVLLFLKLRQRASKLVVILLSIGIAAGILIGTISLVLATIKYINRKEEIRELDIISINVTEIQDTFDANSGEIDKAGIEVTAIISTGESVILAPEEYEIEPETVPERGHDFDITLSSVVNPEVKTSVNCLIAREVYEEYPIELTEPENVKAVLYTNGDLEIVGCGEVKTFTSASVPWQTSGDGVRALCLTWIDPEVVIETMDSWFSGNTEFLGMLCEIPDSTRSMIATFSDCTSLIYCPEFSSAVSLTDMTETFSGCTSLIDVNPLPGNLRVAERTFYGCSSLIEAADTSACVKLENMISCYEECVSLAKTSTPDTVKYMDNCYKNCINIQTGKLPDQLVSGVGTFAGCTQLKRIRGSIEPACEDYSGMFQDCRSLSGTVSVKTKNSDAAGLFPGAAISGTGLTVNLDYVGENDEYNTRAEVMKEMTEKIIEQAEYYDSQITVVDATPPEKTAAPTEAETEVQTTAVPETTAPEETLPVETSAPETTAEYIEPQTKKSTSAAKKKKSSSSTKKETRAAKKKSKKQKQGIFDD